MSVIAEWVVAGAVPSPNDWSSSQPVPTRLWLVGSGLGPVLSSTQVRDCLPYVLMEWSCPCCRGGFWDLSFLVGAAKSHISWDSEARSDDWSVWSETQAGWHGEGAERAGGETEKSRGECNTPNSRGTHTVLSSEQGKLSPCGLRPSHHSRAWQRWAPETSMR